MRQYIMVYQYRSNKKHNGIGNATTKAVKEKGTKQNGEQAQKKKPDKNDKTKTEKKIKVARPSLTHNRGPNRRTENAWMAQTFESSKQTVSYLYCFGDGN